MYFVCILELIGSIQTAPRALFGIVAAPERVVSISPERKRCP